MVQKVFTMPFAKNGSRTPIPDANQPTGEVSYNTGFGPDYDRQLGVDPLAKNIARQNFNQSIYDATQSLQEFQAGLGAVPFNATLAAALTPAGYPKDAVIPRADFNGFWLSTADSNSTDPATGGSWVPHGVKGVFTQALTNVNVTLPLSNAAYPLLVLTGVLTANVTVTLPAWVGYAWVVDNRCTGAFDVSVKTPLGATPVALGRIAVGGLFCDGTEIKASQSASAGRLVNVQTFNIAGTFTYTPSPGTGSVVPLAQAAGGGGGGVQATGASQVAAAFGGQAGAYGEGRFTSAFSGVTITVGAKGVGGVAGPNTGSNGSSSSFGGLLSCPGGVGGIGGTANAAGNSFGLPGPVSAAPSGANIRKVQGQGAGAPSVFSTGQSISGAGGSSFSGPGGQAFSGGAGVNATNPGSGGSGAAVGQSSGSAYKGGDGADGYVIVWEYT